MSSRRFTHFLTATTLFSLCALNVSLMADDQASPAESGVSYYKDIRPIFQSHCQGCHQPAKKGGEYVMTDFSQLLRGGESQEAAIVPGKPDESYLISLITPVDGEAEMPKGTKPLSSVEVDLVRKWIEQGAENDAPASTQPKFSADNPPVYNAAPVITSLHFSPDGKYLAVSGYHEVLIHHSDGSGLAARLVGMSERIETARFSPDSTKIAVTGGSPGRMGELQVWNVSDNSLLFAKTIGYDTLYGANWSPDGKLISYGCPDNTSHALNVEDGKEVLFNGAHDGWVLDTVFSVNGDHLVTVSRDRSMKLINVPTQRFIDNVTSITPGALKGGLNSVDRHPTKDELLCGGADGVPKVYKMFRDKARKIGDDFNLIRAYPALQGRIFSTQFSKDGTKVVSGSSFNGVGQVKVANYEDGKELSSVDLDGGIFSVAFHPNGNTVAAAGFGGEVHLIEAATGKIIKSFVPVTIRTAVAGAAEE